MILWDIYTAFKCSSQAIAFEVWCSCSLFGVGKVGFGYGINFLSDLVWPQVKENKAESYKAAEHIGIREGASILMPSSVSSIKLPRKSSSCELDDDFNCRRAVYPFATYDFHELFYMLLHIWQILVCFLVCNSFSLHFLEIQ